MELNQDALHAAYASVPVANRDMNLIAASVRAYVDACGSHEQKVIAGLNAQLTEQFALSSKYVQANSVMLAALHEIEAAGIRGYLTPELCARIVTEAISKAA